ncbi:MAG: DUF3179 domain-containing protein [Anaerolineae bacterium]|jgi:hypothetical protein
MKRITLLAIGFTALLLLAACGGLVAGVVEPGPVEPLPEPTAAVTATSEQPPAEPAATEEEPAAAPTATEEEPTVAPTATETESNPEAGVLAGDDRPARLRAATRGWNTNWEIHSINYDELLSGGPPRDGIPSIDEPKFVDPDEAADWLADNEPVIALEIGGDARAYPLQILTWHEIANDTVGDVPVAVTFCPLCNSAITFDRRLDGEVYEFGTSGLLRNSDLVMYDRTTESLWQQLTGEAIIGGLTGQRLAFLPSSLVSFADFKAAYPDGIVLSRDTGYARSYGRNPYAGYDTIGNSPFLFDGEEDPRLPAMERVVTVSQDSLGQGIDVAYPLSVLSDMGVINDAQGGIDLAVFHESGTSSALGAGIIAEAEDVGATGVFDPNLDGQKLTFVRQGDQIVDEQTGSTWNVLGQAVDGPLAGQNLAPIVHGDHFWFAWAAFRPDTIVYQSQ